ncbi:MAG TPA: flagellar basal body P-ring formation chaperone FlgA [Desulfuromonadaceae bacterium]
MNMIIRALVIAGACLVLGAPLCQAAQPLAPKQVNRDAEIRDAVVAYVKQKTASLGYDVHVKRISVGGAPKLPDGPLEYEVMAPQQWEGWGAVNLAVLVRQGDRVVSNTAMRVEVEALADMVVTLRQLDHGTVITNADVAIQKRDIATVSGRFAANVTDIVGKQARTTIKANSVVRTDLVEKVPLIRAGQMVSIVAENAVMKLTVAGKARSSGAEGDVIMVQNLNSLKEIPARVVNTTTVQVSF